MKKVYSFDNKLYAATGVHRVLMDVHNAIKDVFDAKVLGTLDYKELHPDLHIKKNEYQRLYWIFDLQNSILIVHQRRLAIIFWLFSFVPFFNLKVVYVHHSILKGNRFMTFFPNNIVTISDKCIENLTEYFGVKREKIKKIHNTVRDLMPGEHKIICDGLIRIIYPAKIYSIKRQLKLVEHLEGKLKDGIKIIFAGDGDEYEQLKHRVKDSNHFECLGYVNNITELLANVDYCMLFSEKEGLSISLIEATMMGVPIICNDVGGNTEIAKDGYNAFICNDWDSLTATVNSLLDVSKDDYIKMSKYSREYYEKYFQYERFKAKYIEYLESL